MGKGIRYQLNNSVDFEIIEELSNENFKVKNLLFGDEKVIELKAILRLHEKGELRFPETGPKVVRDPQSNLTVFKTIDITALNEKDREKVRFKYDAIQPLLKPSNKSLTERINERVIELNRENKKVSASSLRRWFKSYTSSQLDGRSLIDNYDNCGPKEKRTEKQVENILSDIIKEYIRKRENVSSRDIYYELSLRLDKKNRVEGTSYSPVSIATINRRLKEEDIEEVMRWKYGRLHSFSKVGKVEIQKKPGYPLARVEADSTRLDLFVVDKKFREPIGRPHLTSFIDVYTGYPLGFYIGFEPASYVSLMHALRHSISIKDYIRELYPEVQGEWLAYGIPEQLIVDNGKEYHSNDFKDLCIEFGINLIYSPVRTPWYKGTIERHFGTINKQLLHKIPGTSFSNIIDRKDYDPQKNAIIDFEQLMKIVHIFFVDDFAEEKHGKPGRVPKLVWEHASKTLFRPDIATWKPEWDKILGKTEYRSIQRTGIQFEYLFYQSNELHELFKYYKSHYTRGTSDVKFKINPNDLSEIYVYDDYVKKSIITVPATDKEYTNQLTLYQHKVNKNYAKEKYGVVDENTIKKAREQIQKIIDDGLNITLKEKQKENRYVDEGSNKYTKKIEQAKHLLNKQNITAAENYQSNFGEEKSEKNGSLFEEPENNWSVGFVKR